ncbi:Pycsar system effector family protein [Priestia koreensis]|uniref:Pycsar system effector family protein n=1 Tax=Priestia koreensis TaxID=284581 RepID=UPI0033402ABC
MLCFVASWISFSYGAYCLVRVLVPRLKNDVLNHQGTNQSSLYFFETVSSRTFSEFKDDVHTTSEDNEINDILSQIYINSHICTVKYRYYSRGIKFSFVGMAFILILFGIGVGLLKLGGFK